MWASGVSRCQEGEIHVLCRVSWCDFTRSWTPLLTEKKVVHSCVFCIFEILHPTAQIREPAIDTLHTCVFIVLNPLFYRVPDVKDGEYMRVCMCVCVCVCICACMCKCMHVIHAHNPRYYTGRAWCWRSAPPAAPCVFIALRRAHRQRSFVCSEWRRTCCWCAFVVRAHIHAHAALETAQCARKKRI